MKKFNLFSEAFQSLWKSYDKNKAKSKPMIIQMQVIHILWSESFYLIYTLSWQWLLVKLLNKLELTKYCYNSFVQVRFLLFSAIYWNVVQF